MDPSPLVPGTLAGLELFIYWEKDHFAEASNRLYLDRTPFMARRRRELSRVIVFCAAGH